MRTRPALPLFSVKVAKGEILGQGARCQTHVGRNSGRLAPGRISEASLGETSLGDASLGETSLREGGLREASAE